MERKSVMEVLVNLYQMAIAEEIIDGETKEPITIKKFQKMMKDEVLDLTKLIGVELEKEEIKWKT